MERAGIGLAVSELSARYHAAARYDDLVRVRTTLADIRSRAITFDYLITSHENGRRLVTARTTLVSIDSSGRPIALPPAVRSLFDTMSRNHVVSAVCLAVSALCVACAPRLTPLTGVPAPAERMPHAALAPGHHKIVFTWELDDRDMSGRGDGAARIASPDSARLDFVLGGRIRGRSGDSHWRFAFDARQRHDPALRSAGYPPLGGPRKSRVAKSA